jgi:hypothetical protein
MKTLFLGDLGLAVVGCAFFADPDLTDTQELATFNVRSSVSLYEPDLSIQRPVFKISRGSTESVQSILRVRSSSSLDKNAKTGAGQSHAGSRGGTVTGYPAQSLDRSDYRKGKGKHRGDDGKVRVGYGLLWGIKHAKLWDSGTSGQR